MSRSIDLFIHSAASADELAAIIAGRAGLTLERDPGDGAPVVVDGAVRAVLRAHGFEAADDLVLSRYRWALMATTAAAGHLGDAPETRMLRKVSSCLAADHPVLLVLDLQYRTSGAVSPPAGAGPIAAPAAPASPSTAPAPPATAPVGPASPAAPSIAPATPATAHARSTPEPMPSG